MKAFRATRSGDVVATTEHNRRTSESFHQLCGNWSQYAITWDAIARTYTVTDLVAGRDGTDVVGTRTLVEPTPAVLFDAVHELGKSVVAAIGDEDVARLRELAPKHDLGILQLVRLAVHVDDFGDTPFVVDLIDKETWTMLDADVKNRLRRGLPVTCYN